LAIDEGLRGPDRVSGQSNRVAKPGVEISSRVTFFVRTLPIALSIVSLLHFTRTVGRCQPSYCVLWSLLEATGG
jgi:hypothetical protein